MSYIAKVHLLKMFPKKGDNAIHIEDDWLVVPFLNILNPITANNMPLMLMRLSAALNWLVMIRFKLQD